MTHSALGGCETQICSTGDGGGRHSKLKKDKSNNVTHSERTLHAKELICALILHKLFIFSFSSPNQYKRV